MADDCTVTPPTPDCAEASQERSRIKRLRARLRCYGRDVQAVMRHDPAARTRLEAVLTYPGLHALWLHRAAHALWKKDRALAARSLSHVNRFVTGIEIHPGARIGQGVFIDHGMGVVIGETAAVGDGCILFKGVVLGGTTHEHTVRHPQIGRNVVIGTNACVLGNIDVGDGSRIGSGSVVIRPVPDGATVVGVPGRVVRDGDRRARFDDTLDHASLPDPMAEVLRTLRDDNERLRRRLQRIEDRLAVEAEDEDEGETDHLLDASLATRDLPPQHGG